MATQCEIDAYINERLDDQIEWYNKKSSSNQSRFKWCKWTEMALGGIIAVLTPAITDYEFIKYIVAASSAGIVIVVALHGLHNFHENWIEYRKTSELLKNEKDLEINESNIQIQMTKIDGKWEIENAADFYIALYGGQGQVSDLPAQN